MTETASKLLSNLLIMFSSLTIVPIMFIIITVIIICTKKVLITVPYKLQYLCTSYRQMPCATVKLIF